MGACQSCLGLGRREENEAENARLIDDDLYPGGYGYGSINNANQQQSDPEDLKREREALEAICQRASDTVIDIWALQSQPNLQPRATLRNSEYSPGSSRVPSNEMRSPVEDDEHERDTTTATTTITTTMINTQQGSGTVRSTTSSSSSSAGKQRNLAPVPNHWNEVVISPRRKKNYKIGSTKNDGEIFDVLKVL